MKTNILVAYASKHGATAEIAEKIGEVLQAAGLPAQVLPVEGVKDLEPYTAIVLGSAVYFGRWLKGAIAFLESHEAALSARPVWLFSSGPTGEGDPVELLQGWNFPDGQQEVVDRLQPRAVAVFHGALDPADLDEVERSLIKSIKAPLGDFRDWQAVTDWAKGIAESLAHDGPAN